MSKIMRPKTPFEFCVYPVLKEALEKTNYNQTELAKSLGTSQFTASAWVRGENDYGATLIDCKLHCTGCQRSGCMFCGFGSHLEKGENRFERMKHTHPKHYEFCIGGGEWDTDGLWKPNEKGLGYGRVLDFIGVRY